MKRTPLKRMAAHPRLNPILLLLPLCFALLCCAALVSAEVERAPGLQ